MEGVETKLKFCLNKMSMNRIMTKQLPKGYTI